MPAVRQGRRTEGWGRGVGRRGVPRRQPPGSEGVCRAASGLRRTQPRRGCRKVEPAVVRDPHRNSVFQSPSIRRQRGRKFPSIRLRLMRPVQRRPAAAAERAVWLACRRGAFGRDGAADPPSGPARPPSPRHASDRAVPVRRPASLHCAQQPPCDMRSQSRRSVSQGEIRERGSWARVPVSVPVVIVPLAAPRLPPLISLLVCLIRGTCREQRRVAKGTVLTLRVYVDDTYFYCR